MKLAYIAGKLNDEACGYLQNLHRMINCADKVKKLGYAVFVPGVDLLMGLQMGNYEYSDFFDNSQEILSRCDIVVLTPGWETSKGTKKEIELANQLDIPVFRWSVTWNRLVLRQRWS